MSNRKKTDQQVRDEAIEAESEREYQEGEIAEAKQREGERQAAVERDRVLDALDAAHDEAASKQTAAEAKKTFWQKLKGIFAGDGM